MFSPLLFSEVTVWRTGRTRSGLEHRPDIGEFLLYRFRRGLQTRTMSSRGCGRVLQSLQTLLPVSSGSWSRFRAGSWCRCRLQTGTRPEPCRGLSGSSRGTMNVFNREMKKRQKNWSASLQDGNQYDYLRDEVCLTVLTLTL